MQIESSIPKVTSSKAYGSGSREKSPYFAHKDIETWDTNPLNKSHLPHEWYNTWYLGDLLCHTTHRALLTFQMAPVIASQYIYSHHHCIISA